MTKTNDSIYPVINKDGEFTTGLTKRELFAAMALQGMLANPDLTKTDDVTIAMTCIDAADALIKALNQ